MVAYIKEIAETFITTLRAQGSVHPLDQARALFGELSLLDARDFAPDARAEFAQKRSVLRRWIEQSIVSADHRHLLTALTQDIIRLLDRHGPLAQAPTRTFRWLSDADLRRIVERDYVELSELVFKNGAWKSSVVMAGSIAEAILFDVLTKHSAYSARAKTSGKRPRRNNRLVDEDDWRLVDLIDIATDIGLMPQARAGTFDQVVRDYRNFVHPKKEIRARHEPGEGEALLAHGALIAFCDHLDRTIP